MPPSSGAVGVDPKDLRDFDRSQSVEPADPTREGRVGSRNKIDVRHSRRESLAFEDNHDNVQSKQTTSLMLAQTNN